MGAAIERWCYIVMPSPVSWACYIVMSSLIGRAHTQNDTCKVQQNKQNRYIFLGMYILGTMIFQGYPAKRALSALRKHGG